jgi:plasmid stabilization system protein ParE
MASSSSRSYERSVKLQVAKRAQRQADKIEDWWVDHRPAAPTLFTDELEQTFERIREMPGAGVPCPTPRRPELRRILMPKTQNHVYFRVDATQQIVRILAIWGAPRGRVPKL